MMLLALDLSSVVGWAFGRAGATQPDQWGTWTLRDPDLPRSLGREIGSCENEIEKLLDPYPADCRVVVEAPFLTSSARGQTNADVLMQQVGLYTAVLTSCWRCDVAEPVKRSVTTVRARVLGRGRFENRATAKAAVMEWCHRKGWRVPDDNAADACLLWLYESWFLSPNGTRPPKEAQVILA